MKYFLGIDTGTTSISIAAIDSSGQMITHRTLNHSSFIEGESFNKIQNPERIKNFVNDILVDIMKTFGTPSGIGLTGQMHGMLYVNAHGDSVSPLYTWEDQSGIETVKILREHGMKCSVGYGLATHLYLQMSKKIPNDAVKMTTISDYIAMKLCGNTSPVLSSDMAASWGCFDLRTHEFMYDSLKSAGVNVSYLPEIVRGYHVIGHTKENVPVVCSVGDNQAAVKGSLRDSEDDSLLLNVGTGSQISLVTNEYYDSEGDIETRPYGENKYILSGASLCGGRAYALLEGFYRSVSGHECYDVMMKDAEKFIETYGMSNAWEVETTFSGTRSNPNKRGSISGISTENFCPGAFTAGVIRGIVEELHGMYEAMKTMTGREAKYLAGSGNGLRKNKLMQRIASEMFGMEVHIPEYTEEAACGAAMCAMKIACM